MSYYRHVLVGLDLSPESELVVDHVQELFDDREVKISLIHVQEPLSFAYGGDIPMDLSEVQTQMEQQARVRLDHFCRQLGVPESDGHVRIGQPAQEMHHFAQEHDVDLTVVGSHGRHGLALIFGSTANGVLHGATCDVLAVHIPKST
ncbi:MAG TPA: universal stress protein UspA [Porticoccaceae bacterium]|jgi:universal stress protein A|nr:universal stress protein UspA [Porticoccaceae bacterium]